MAATSLLSLFDHVHRFAEEVGGGQGKKKSLEFAHIASFLDIGSLLNFGMTCKQARLLSRAAGERRVEEFIALYVDFADPQALNTMLGMMGWQRQLRWGTTHPIKTFHLEGGRWSGCPLPNGNILLGLADRIVISCGRSGVTPSESGLDIDGAEAIDGLYSIHYSAEYVVVRDEYVNVALMWKLTGNYELLESKRVIQLPAGENQNSWRNLPQNTYEVAKDVPVHYSIHDSTLLIEYNLVTGQKRMLRFSGITDDGTSMPPLILLFDKYLLVVGLNGGYRRPSVRFGALSIHRGTMTTCHALSFSLPNQAGKDAEFDYFWRGNSYHIVNHWMPNLHKQIELDPANGRISTREIYQDHSNSIDKLSDGTHIQWGRQHGDAAQYDTATGRKVRVFSSFNELLWVTRSNQTIASVPEGRQDVISLFSLKSEEQFLGRF